MNFPPNGFPPPGFPAPAPLTYSNGQPVFPQSPAPAQTPYGAQTGAPAGYPAPGGFTPPQYPAQPMPAQFGGYPQPGMAPMPQNLCLDADLATADEKDGDLPPLPQGGHELIEVLRIYPYRSPTKQHVITFKADCVVVKSSLVPPGTRFCFQERVTGHDYPNHKADSIARVRSFLAALDRIDPNSPQAKTQINEAVIQVAWSDANPYKGRQCAITSVVHKMTKAKLNQFGQQVAPRAIGKYSFGVAGSAVAAPVQAAPQAQAPAAPVAATFPPAGWQSAEPAYPGHFHNGRECITEAQLRALMAAGRA
jgi:hypothetical protein